MAEGSGLLNRQRVKLLVGSNPTSSAITKSAPIRVPFLFAEDEHMLGACALGFEPSVGDPLGRHEWGSSE